MLYLNYEYAQSLLDGPDPIVAVVGMHLHNEVISENSRKLRPRWPFHVPYFYLSVSAVVASVIERQLSVSSPLPRLIAAGIPNLHIEPWRSYDFTVLGLAARYIDKVNADSAPGPGLGRFDVEFALQIASCALDREFLGSLNDRIAAYDPIDLDDWDRWCECWSTPKDGD